MCWEEGLPRCPWMAAPTRPPEASMAPQGHGPHCAQWAGPTYSGRRGSSGPLRGRAREWAFHSGLGVGAGAAGPLPWPPCPVSRLFPVLGPPQGERPQDRCGSRLERLEVNIQAGLRTCLLEAGAVGTPGRVRVRRGRSRADPHLRGSLTSVPAGSEAGPCPPPSAPPGAQGKGVGPCGVMTRPIPALFQALAGP